MSRQVSPKKRILSSRFPFWSDADSSINTQNTEHSSAHGAGKGRPCARTGAVRAARQRVQLGSPQPSSASLPTASTLIGVGALLRCYLQLLIDSMDSAACWWSWCAASLVGIVRADDELHAGSDTTDRLRKLTACLAAGSHPERREARRRLKGRSRWLKEEVLAVESVLKEAQRNPEEQQALLGKVFLLASRLETASRLCTALASAFFSGIAANRVHRLAADREKHSKLHSRLRAMVVRAVTLSTEVKGLLTQALLLSPNKRVLGKESLEVRTSCLGQPQGAAVADAGSTAGSGLFATVPIAAGTLIGEYRGEALCADEVYRRFSAAGRTEESRFAVDSPGRARNATGQRQHDDEGNTEDSSDRKRRRLQAAELSPDSQQREPRTADYLMRVADDAFIDASSTDPAVTNRTRYINHAPSGAFSGLCLAVGSADATAESLNRSHSNIGAFGCCVDAGGDADDDASEIEAVKGDEDSRHQQEQHLRARRRPRLVLFALRHIDAGEELFLDYGSEYWRDRPSPLSGIRGRQKPMRSIESSDQTA